MMILLLHTVYVKSTMDIKQVSRKRMGMSSDMPTIRAGVSFAKIKHFDRSLSKEKIIVVDFID